MVDQMVEADKVEGLSEVALVVGEMAQAAPGWAVAEVVATAAVAATALVATAVAAKVVVPAVAAMAVALVVALAED